MAKPNPKRADLGPLDYYTKVPSSKDGEFVHAQAVVADLSKPTFADSRRTGDGVFAMSGSQRPTTGSSKPTSPKSYDNSASSKPPAR